MCPCPAFLRYVNINGTKDVICMERKQGKKLISLTQAENKELSMIDCGKLINENIRMLKECQTQEEMTRLLKTASELPPLKEAGAS